jgi:uncharacterized protein YjbI with pentapeptide repeats
VAVHSYVDPPTCIQDGCIGVRLTRHRRCWAHAEVSDLDVHLEQLGKDGQLDGRGVAFKGELLKRVLDAIPQDNEGHGRLSAALFDGATFADDASFVQVTFTGDVSFRGATFTGDAEFREVTFEHYAEFDLATFTGSARFGEATFTAGASFDGATFTGWAGFSNATFTGGGASFGGATFKGPVRFVGTTFTGDAWFSRATFTGDDVSSFSGATFTGDSRFDRATFTGDTRFDRATFTGDARFSDATFEGDARFSDATFEGIASFDRTTFERARQLGPMLVRESLVLDGASFRERVQIELSAAVLSCERARFLGGVQLRVRWALVVLDGADLAAPSVLNGARPFVDLDEGDLPRVAESAWPVDSDDTPQLLSVRGADVAGLTVAGVDLRACRFVDAHHLDQLRAEGSTFARTPPGWRWTKRRTIRRWTIRRTIAEEQQWRASHDDPGWYGLAHEPPDWLTEVKPLEPAEIAPIYRDLRKGLEDNKDEPGAADFYYGEMEMRRHAKRPRIRGFDISAAAEWAILTLYWLVSGYGLRAWRALASLTAVVLVASVIFACCGFDQPEFRPVGVNAQGELVYERNQGDRPASWDELPAALRYSAQATTALLRGPDVQPLTAVGEWVQIALRLIGPVLLGLAVLSVRGRVKR